MIVKNRAFYIVLDIASIIISFILAAFERESVIKNKASLELWFGCMLLIFVYVLVLLFYQPKKALMKRGPWAEFRVVATVNFQMALLLAAILYLFKATNRFPRSFYIFFFVFNVIWMYMGRVILKRMILMYYENPSNKKHLIICANESNIQKALQKFKMSSLYEYEVVAIAVVKGGMNAPPDDNKIPTLEIKKVVHGLGGITTEARGESLETFLRHQVIDEALLSLPDSTKKELSDLVNKLETMGIQTHVTINTFSFGQKEKVVQNFGIYHVLTYSPRIFEPTELFLKRVMDVAGGLIGVLLTLVIGIFVAPAIYIESPGNIIFKQIRIGRNGRRFNIYKFRSMYPDAEKRKKDLMEQNEMNGLMFKIKDDPRITKVGKFIRRTSIDEFPQFFNVLKGDMSLVGTRPPTEEEFLQYEERHKRRLSLKPGITGMWQVKGRSGITDFEDVVKMDLEYIDNWSIWLDVKLLFQTIAVVIKGKGAE